MEPRSRFPSERGRGISRGRRAHSVAASASRHGVFCLRCFVHHFARSECGGLARGERGDNALRKRPPQDRHRRTRGARRRASAPATSGAAALAALLHRHRSRPMHRRLLQWIRTAVECPWALSPALARHCHRGHQTLLWTRAAVLLRRGLRRRFVHGNQRRCRRCSTASTLFGRARHIFSIMSPFLYIMKRNSKKLRIHYQCA